MGKYDSSKTRVEPLFNNLYAHDRTGRSWLPGLVNLPIYGRAVSLPSSCDFEIYEHLWGKNEKKLKPPVALLSWLIRHPQNLQNSKGAEDREMPKERRELLGSSLDRMLEALYLLQNNPAGARWHIFEGETQPDVFIETRNLLIVVEGKRTEREPTTETKWMPVRHQMLRHLDGEWEVRGTKQVLGFFIVEGDSDGDVPTAWREFSMKTISEEAIASSLPHRGPEERHEIASCFAGVTTWQKVCRKFAKVGVEYASLPDEVNA